MHCNEKQENLAEIKGKVVKECKVLGSKHLSSARMQRPSFELENGNF
jgi:hypothetical protein